MYFVTTKQAGYVMFCMTPSERAAIALAEDAAVAQLLIRDPSTGKWKVARNWQASDFSPTDFMSALIDVDEPADPLGLIAYLPAGLRD